MRAAPVPGRRGRTGQCPAFGVVWAGNGKRFPGVLPQRRPAADRRRAGPVWVNNYRSTSFTTPFGGYKRSGLGREGGVEAIKEYLQTKSVWITTKPNRANPFVLG